MSSQSLLICRLLSRHRRYIFSRSLPDFWASASASARASPYAWVGFGKHALSLFFLRGCFGWAFTWSWNSRFSVWAQSRNACWTLLFGALFLSNARNSGQRYTWDALVISHGWNTRGTHTCDTLFFSYLSRLCNWSRLLERCWVLRSHRTDRVCCWLACSTKTSSDFCLSEFLAFG